MSPLELAIRNSQSVSSGIEFQEYDEYTRNSGYYKQGLLFSYAYLVADHDAQESVLAYINQIAGESFRPQSYRHAFIDRLRDMDCTDPAVQFELKRLISSFSPLGYKAIIPDLSEEQTAMNASEATCNSFGKAYHNFIGLADIRGKSVVDIGGGASDCTAILASRGANARCIDVRAVNIPSLRKDAKAHILSQNISHDEAADQFDALSNFLIHNFQHPESYLPVNASNTHLADESVDIALSNYLITGCMRKDPVLQWYATREALRILKQGGFLHLYPYDDSEKSSDIGINSLLKGSKDFIPVVYQPQGLEQKALIIAKAFQNSDVLPHVLYQLSDKMLTERV